MSENFKGLPKIVKVIGKRYKVLVVEKVDDEDSYGEHQVEKQEVKIRRDNHGFEQSRDTVLHEFVHAIEDQLNLELKERQVHQLAAALFGLMRDNPKLVKWLMMREPKEKAPPAPEKKED